MKKLLCIFALGASLSFMASCTPTDTPQPQQQQTNDTTTVPVEEEYLTWKIDGVQYVGIISNVKKDIGFLNGYFGCSFSETQNHLYVDSHIQGTYILNQWYNTQSMETLEIGIEGTTDTIFTYSRIKITRNDNLFVEGEFEGSQCKVGGVSVGTLLTDGKFKLAK